MSIGRGKLEKNSGLILTHNIDLSKKMPAKIGTGGRVTQLVQIHILCFHIMCDQFSRNGFQPKISRRSMDSMLSSERDGKSSKR